MSFNKLIIKRRELSVDKKLWDKLDKSRGINFNKGELNEFQ